MARAKKATPAARALGAPGGPGDDKYVPVGGPGDVKARQGSGEVLRWIRAEYRAALGLGGLEGGEGYRAFLEAHSDATALLRIQAFWIVKFGYPLRRVGYTVAAFSGRLGAPAPAGAAPAPAAAEAYYAYAYWPEGGGEPEYISVGGTFSSRDGEYRPSFLWYPQFREGLALHREELAPCEDLVLAALGAGELALDVRLFPETAARAAHPALEEGRLGVEALAVLLALEGARALAGELAKHRTPGYKKLLLGLCSREPSLFAGQSEGTLEQDSRLRRLRVFRTGDGLRSTSCGQKLSPLSVREALHVGDLGLPAWREAWVGQRAADLVINGASPGFALYGNWAVVEGDATLYENAAMRAKFVRSVEAGAVVEALRVARESTKGLVPQTRHLEQLDARLYEALVYAQNYVLQSGVSLCTVTEYVGPTVEEVYHVLTRQARAGLEGSLHSQKWQPALSCPALATRYLFDFCYGAHALHTRVGAIHTDLHLNNLTFFTLRLTGGLGRRADTRIAYVAGPHGERETYVFAHDGSYGGIIDFSRSLLGPAAREALAEEKGVCGAAQFFADQARRGLRVLEQYAPLFAKKHQVRLRALLMSAPDQAFRAMSAVDFLALGLNYGGLLRRTSAEGLLAVDPQALGRAEKMARLAVELLVGGLTDLLAAPSPDAAKVPYAGEALLPQVFGDHLYSRLHAEGGLRGAELVEVHSLAAPGDYSGDYSSGRWPPWADLGALEARLGETPLEEVTAGRGARPFLQAQGSEDYLGALQEAVRQSHAHPPAAPGSSWLSPDQ